MDRESAAAEKGKEEDLKLKQFRKGGKGVQEEVTEHRRGGRN